VNGKFFCLYCQSPIGWVLVASPLGDHTRIAFDQRVFPIQEADDGAMEVLCSPCARGMFEDAVDAAKGRVR
jgi:hypothetical protein